jgi:hypothetical protein
MFNEEVIAAATELAARLAEDIPLSRTRDEHIRVTARANEAANLLKLITDNAVLQRSQ